MSWLFSQALAAEFSRATCSDGEPSAQLSMMPTAQPFLRNDRPMDYSHFSRFGLTCAPLTADRGEALLMWFRQGFHARTSALPERASDSTARDQDSGFRRQGSFAKWDHDSSTWKTRQLSLLGGSVEFSEIWPRWGSMRNGESLARPTPERRTEGNESGLWATPEASGGGGCRAGTWNGTHYIKPNGQKAQTRLIEQVRRNMIPTPTASDANSSGSRNTVQSKAHPGISLTDWIRDDGGKGRVSNTEREGLEGCGGGYAGQSQESESRDDRSADIGRDWPPEPGVGRVVDGMAHRVDRLKALGNGQVPRVGKTAWRLLIAAIMECEP